MDTLSNEQLADLRETFDSFDENKDGTICIKELKKMMTQFSKHEPTEEELSAIMKHADTNRNNLIDFDEFVAIMVQCSPKDPEEQIHQAFAVFDKDGNGTINAEELKQVLKTLGETVTSDEVDDLIREIDLDGDGQIDYHEFVKIMMEKKETL